MVDGSERYGEIRKDSGGGCPDFESETLFLATCAVARVGGGGFELVGFNQATGLVSPLRRQIFLNPVWLGGLRYSASLRSPSDRSGERALTHSPPAKPVSDKFGSSLRDQTGWLD